jgi:hypothetical protein
MTSKTQLVKHKSKTEVNTTICQPSQRGATTATKRVAAEAPKASAKRQNSVSQAKEEKEPQRPVPSEQSETVGD